MVVRKLLLNICCSLILIASYWQGCAAATFIVTTTSDSGPGSFREAISLANSNSGSDTVTFDLGVFPTGLMTDIILDSPVRLSDISGSTAIEGDGRVHLTANTGEFNGIEITTGGNLIRGLQITGFRSGVVLIRNTDTANNVIGGVLPTQRNVIANNWLNGIALDGPGAVNNLVIGNYIGLDPTGTTAWGEQAIGVNIAHGAHDNIIGGTTDGERNVISGNTFTGVAIDDTTQEGTRSNHIRGNYIGTDHTGMVAVPNNQGGIGIGFDTNGNVVGGTETGSGNVISGHTGLTPHGIRVGTLGSDNFIYGNIIGLTADGSTPLPNGFGIYMAGDTFGNRIGGSGPNEANIISGNSEWAIAIGENANDNVIEGNYIGTDPAGNQLANRRGIRVGGSSNNRFGPSNRIWFNTDYAILLDDVTTIQNVITQNSITANGEGNLGRGINLVNGANASILPPAITSVTENEVSGTAGSADGSIIEIFQDEVDQGKIYIGSTSLAGGLFTFTGSSPFIGGNLTATVTDPTGNTSEFSPPVPNELQPPSQALEWEFTKVVDTDTSLPGGVGFFTGFSLPSLDGDNIAFIGSDNNLETGLYIDREGVLSVVVDESTPIPGGSGSFTGFGSWPSLDSEDVAFYAYGQDGLEGIYKLVGGVLSVVADTQTSIPDGEGVFDDFLVVASLASGDVTFLGRGTDQVGIYADIGGELSVVADRDTMIPGGLVYFEYFGLPSLDQETVSFIGRGDGREGIYRGADELLSVVADVDTPIPGGTGNFSDFTYGGPSADDGKVAFQASGSGQYGIFLEEDQEILIIADIHTSIPGGSGDFTSFNDPSLDLGNVAFRGAGAGQLGIYVNTAGVLSRVVDLNSLLNGKIPTSFNLGPEGMSGTSVAFHVSFADGTNAIYRADLAGVDPGVITDLVESLPEGVFSSGGTQNALMNILDSIQGAIDRGQINLAIRLLERRRMFVDGCDGTPDETPDANDWILDCDAQREIRALIDLLIADLSGD